MVTEDRSYDRALAEARALIEAGRATGVVIQDGRVYVEGGTCAGCATRGTLLVDDHANAGNPWCPSCGGRALVHLDLTEAADFENGLCRIGTSKVVHLVAPPHGEHPLCMPNAQVGRMRPAKGDTEPTCQRCILARDAAGQRSTQRHNPYAKQCVKRSKGTSFFSDAHCSVCETTASVTG